MLGVSFWLLLSPSGGLGGRVWTGFHTPLWLLSSIPAPTYVWVDRLVYESTYKQHARTARCVPSTHPSILAVASGGSFGRRPLGDFELDSNQPTTRWCDAVNRFNSVAPPQAPRFGSAVDSQSIDLDDGIGIPSCDCALQLRSDRVVAPHGSHIAYVTAGSKRPPRTANGRTRFYEHARVMMIAAADFHVQP